MKTWVIFLILLYGQGLLGQDDFKRVHLFNTLKDKQTLQLTNALINASLYAYWVNKSINGSGTRNPHLPIQLETTPYQFLRVLSLFDLHFTHSLENLKNQQDKTNFSYFTTLMKPKDIAVLPAYSLPILNLPVIQVAKSLFPLLERNEFRVFTNEQIILTANGHRFSDSFQNIIYKELKEKLSFIWERVFTSFNKKIINRETLSDILVPLMGLFNIHLDKKAQSHYNISFYLPGLANIKNQDKQGKPLELSQWQLIPGLSLDISNPVVGLTQILNNISYLQDTPTAQRKDALKKNIIAVHLSKDLKKVDQMGVTLEFGTIPKKIFSSQKINLLPIDTKGRQGSLKVAGYLSFKKKTPLNKLLKKFYLEAWVHRLHLDLVRDKTYKTWETRFKRNPTFQIKDNIEKTILSVRLKKGANRKAHAFFLKGLGFTCKKGDRFFKEEGIKVFKNYKYTCIADYSNSKDFESKYFTRIGRPIIRKLLGEMSSRELQYQFSDLNMGAKVVLSENKDLITEIIKILNNNVALMELLYLLPGNIPSNL
jgi:hypothetical protein